MIRQGEVAMNDALIIDACRTPRGIGKVGKGSLADMHPQRLASSVLAALAERNGLNTADVDDVIWGTSTQSGDQGGDLGRMAALECGMGSTSERRDTRSFLWLGDQRNQLLRPPRSRQVWKILSWPVVPR